MNKFYIILCFITVVSFKLTAQNKFTTKADNLFNKYEYVDAAAAYLKLVEEGKSDNYVNKQLATTYFNMFNTVEAAKWYAKVVEAPQDAETYFNYSQMLKANGEYEEANKQMQKFASLAPNDQRAIAFKRNPNYIPRLLEEQKWFDIKIADFNSEKSDFGAVLNGNSVYFATARNGARKTYGWNDEPYLDIYKGDYNPDGTVTNTTAINALNTKFHDGPVTLTADGNTIFFASNSFRENSFSKDKKNNLKLGKNNLFRATKEGEKWTKITSLPFNSNAYSTSNPSISKDGKTLYFSSDMPGSIGGVDIWKVKVNADGSYGTPENLGNNINTEGNESFPFINEDNATLYFASNGKQGFGGLDVFQVDLSKNTAPTNLGMPVNTEKDDFALTFNSEKNIGYLSSNRSGFDDIYVATPVCAVQVLATVTNAKTGDLLSNAAVAIIDDNKNVITTEMTNDKGEVSYRVDCNKQYAIQASKEGFESNTFTVAKSSKAGKTIVNAALLPINEIVTDKEVVLNPIFFEFDKSNITQEAAFELNKLVEAMQTNPNMIILVKSHTDNKGSDSYNLSLSDRRAKSTVQYVISKGIASTRISGKGFGDSEPLVDCKESCTSEQDATNRRSEFLIVQ